MAGSDGVESALEAVAVGLELRPSQAFALLQGVRCLDRRVLEALPVRKTASPIDLRLGTCYIVSRAIEAPAPAPPKGAAAERECTPVTFQSVLNSRASAPRSARARAEEPRPALCARYVHWSADAPDLGVAVCAMSRARRKTTARAQSGDDENGMCGGGARGCEACPRL